MENTNNDSPIVNDDKLIGQKIKAVPKPNQQHEIDTNGEFINQVVDAGLKNQLDVSVFTGFTTESQSRDAYYDMIDSMCNDPTIAAALETYAEDATEYNDKGDIIWATSSKPKIGNYINFLLKALQVNKHAYDWVMTLCKYGDLYLELFKESELKQDIFFDDKQKQPDVDPKKALNEDVKVKAFKQSDKYMHYIEAVANPAKMFELTRVGKTSGFIEADIVASIARGNNNKQSALFKFNFKKNDIILYEPNKFAHACLINDCNRYPEEVNIFLNDRALEENDFINYKVKRGQPLLYNLVKIWRELSLLENSMLLNRATKSSIIRLINVEVADMPKEQVGGFLQRVKSLVEQKAAITTNESMQEYTNPGPVENNIYVPTHNGQGAITAGQIGGDFNVSQIPDVEYFQNKFFGALRIPKQYFGLTDDAAGFSGGESLAIISSRYAKMVKRIQNTLIQALTTVINILLIDKHQDNYIGQFTIHMQPPTTKEENDRRDSVASKIQIVGDIMNLISDIDNATIKLKILKSLLADVINDDDVVALIQQEIDKLETQTDDTASNDLGENSGDFKPSSGSSDFSDDVPLDLDSALGINNTDNSFDDLDTGNSDNLDTDVANDNTESLPTPDELGIDMTDNNAEL